MQKMEDSTKTKIQEAFTSMSYGENIENTDKANVWLKTVEIVDKSNAVDSVLRTIKLNESRPKKQLLTKLAQEIEKSSELLSQIEILSRGVLSKDTKNAVSILAQYFYYYANFVPRNEKEGANWNHKGCIVGVFDDENPLWTLGLVLAPAIAAGHTVLLQTGTKIAAAVTYVLELAKKVGISEDSLVLVPSNEGELQPYLSSEIVIAVALFVDLLDAKYRGINKFNKKLLVFSSYKVPMLVFENADLDSAVDCVVESVWGYQGMLPWSVNTIIIQENVFQKFTDKLKMKLDTVRTGNGNDKNADISFPSNSSLHAKLTKTIEKAKELGIEVFQSDTKNNFSPTLIIGSRVYTNNVLKTPENDGALTLVAFRSIDEAVNLANNSRQGIGASVWSENVGLVNEVSRKLKVNNVWINSHGLFSVEICLTPLKDSGKGCFGGKEGFYEYSQLKNMDNPILLEVPKNLNESIEKVITSGKSATLSWSKNSYLNRVKLLQQMGDLVENKRKQLAENVTEKWLENFISHLDYVILNAKEYGSSVVSGYTMMSLKLPKGVLVIEMRRHIERHNLKLLLAAILEGNAVILLNDTRGFYDTQGFYQELSKILPKGVLEVFPYSLEAVKTAASHKELNGYLASESNIIFGSLPLADSKIFSIVADDWDEVFREVTVAKNIWSNVGQSSQCSL